MPITVNADDFGISPEVNKAIAESFEKGLINRTTLMVNMPYAKEAMEIAEKCGFDDRVGLHLNLTAGKPLSDNISKDRVMCGPEGEFTADFARNMKTRFVFGRSTAISVGQEIKAQLEKYRELGGSLWHVDSHHHVHTDPSVYNELRKYLKEYPVKSVRLGRNMYHGGNVLMRVFKLLLNCSIRSYCSIKEDYFGSAADYNEYTENMTSEEKTLFDEKHNIEIMVHPMYDDDGKLTDSLEAFRKYL